ncbi:MAG: adenylate/guanylate cyclase domain-containing protein [Actinobacteria bacterium]|nr:adenylate/guanylate cyclase domain-containing protein [Actinomycetota bacterium]MBV9936333.1 adenylate/guanylate cyclase domain-containing protein [Actinomycetota bacterium]
MPTPREARDAGRSAVQGFRRSLAQRAVDALENHDPELLDSLVEVGVVRREWVEDGKGPMSTSAPLEVVERLLERSVERRPSLLSRLGLSTIQVLSTSSEEASDEAGAPARMVVAFTDLEGFTRFTAAQGDEAASQLLADHHRRVGPIVRSRGGRVVKRLGDGLLLTFPEPEAGVLACLELVAAQPDPLRLRAGLHYGDIVTTRDDVIGHVVNVAARVAESAKGGEVLVTVDVREAAADSLPQVTFGRARRRYFKGIDEAVSVCPVSR